MNLKEEKTIYQAYVDGFNDGLFFALRHLRELKELLIGNVNASITQTKPIGSSNKSKPRIERKIAKSKPNNQKVTLQQIKMIKDMAQQGLNDKIIAERLNIKPSLIPYWRKNTPKELNV